MAVVSRRMAQQYPKSLTDRLNGDIVGVGYSLLVEQMMHHVENIKRLSIRSNQLKMKLQILHWQAAVKDPLHTSPKF